MKNINTQQLEEKIRNKENFILLDVRTFEEFNEGHIANAILLPVQVLSEENLNKVGLNEKNQEIVLYCRTGSRSIFASQILESLGFTNILNLEEGILGGIKLEQL